MQLGLIGLGRMGGNMRERLRAAGQEVVGYDHHQESSDAASLAELVEKLAAPRVIWTMVPAGQITEDTIDELGRAALRAGDIIIDGGNSSSPTTRPRAERLTTKGIHYIDVGVSGGVWGITNGYALMVGGDAETWRAASRSSTRSSRPASSASRTPARTARATTRRWSTTASSTA